MGSPQRPPLSPGWDQLEEFIFHPDQYHAETVPRGLPRDSVAKFVDARIVSATPRGPLLQTEKVVDFYDLQEVCPHLRDLPQKNEKSPDDVTRSTIIIRALALVCLPQDVDFSLDYTKRLVALSSTLPEFQQLIFLDDVLGNTAGLPQLKSRMELRLVQLSAKRQSDYQAQLEYANLEDALNNSLGRCQKAAEQKSKILAISGRAARIQEEIKIYLTIDYGYLEFLYDWSVRRLRRETWGPQPAQQVERADKPELREDVVKAFRAAMVSLSPSPEIPKENLPALRIRCLRAIEYFGGQLSKSEQEFIAKNAGNQVDPLSK